MQREIIRGAVINCGASRHEVSSAGITVRLGLLSSASISIWRTPRPAPPTMVPVDALLSYTDSLCGASPALPHARRMSHAALPRYLIYVLGLAAPPALADLGGGSPVRAAPHLVHQVQSGSRCPPATAPRTGPAGVPWPGQRIVAAGPPRH